MSLKVDPQSHTCACEINGMIHRLPIGDIAVRTDARMRASVIDVAGERVMISEEEAQRLVGLGAEDDRRNLVVDE